MPSANPPSEATAPIFPGVNFFLAQGLPTATLDHMRELLVEHGGVEAENAKMATHVISSSDCFIGVDEAKEAITVTPAWVERSVILGKLQDPRYFSTDPHKIFSGVVATSSDLPLKDSEAIAAGIVAFGGQWRDTLTSDVSHLFCLTASGPKYAKALSGQGNPLQIQVVAPHWFSDCFKSETLLSTKNYLFPNPAVLNPDFNEKMVVGGAPEDIADDSKTLVQRRLLRAAIGVDLEPESNSGTQPSSSNKGACSNRVLGDKRVLFSARAVQNDPNRDQVYRRRVEQVGGIYISGLSLGGDGVSRAALEDADVFITSYRDNEEYDLATTCNVIIGTPAWILYVTSTGLWSAPKEHLLHYPYPEKPVPGLEEQLITITNYVGDAREYIKKLISALGGKFSPSLTSKITCVIASHITVPPEQSKQNKISKAREWRIPVVNHLWLEDCFREWAKLPVSDQKYLNFPQGHDWTKEINARGVGNGPIPTVHVARDRNPEIHQNGHSVHAPSEVDNMSRPTSPSKPASTLKATPTSKPRSTSRPRSASKPIQNSSASERTRDAAPPTEDASSHASPSKITKSESAKRKSNADTSQLTKRPKTTEPVSGKDTAPPPQESTARHPSETVSVGPSSPFVKPLSEVRHRGPIKLLSPDKGKRKSRKASSDEEGSNHDSDSSSSTGSPARRNLSPPAMSTGGRAQRAAATAAQDRLRNVIMPDVQKFQNEMSSSKGDVRKMEQLAEKKQRRTSMVNHDNDDAPPFKKKKVQGDDDIKSVKSQATKSSQGKNEPKKEFEKAKSVSSNKNKSKPTEEDKPRKLISTSVRIVCSKSKPTESEMKQMERLGAKFTEDDPSQCTHLVVNAISRTEKFLCAFPVCSHVVTMRWLQDSIKEGKLQDEGQYRLSDPDNEKRYAMTLGESLKRIKANKGKLLEGHTFFVTDNVGVEFKSMQRVIESSGGVAKFEAKPTKKKIGNDMKHNHVISSQEAKPSWQALIKENVPIYSKEFILNGILRQELNWSADRIH
ncbi:BRCT domain-containing protein [Rhizoctonia solani]|nr:BRCT domain-containing protein [Rhizoctonia solani]